MSLDWKITEINDFETLCYVEKDGERRLSGITECLIWATIMVDIGRITAKNARRFHNRCIAWETVHGSLRSDGEMTQWEDVQSHIGLATNVVTQTDADFRKKLMRSLEEKAARKRQQQEATTI